MRIKIITLVNKYKTNDKYKNNKEIRFIVKHYKYDKMVDNYTKAKKRYVQWKEKLRTVSSKKKEKRRLFEKIASQFYLVEQVKYRYYKKLVNTVITVDLKLNLHKKPLTDIPESDVEGGGISLFPFKKNSKIHPTQSQPTQPQPTDQPQPTQPQPKVLIIFVFGIGCEFQKEEELDKIKGEILDNFYLKNNDIGIDLKIYCNRSAMNTYCEVGKMYCSLEPPTDTKVINGLNTFVTENFKNYRNTYIFGFSYGGSIVSRLAMNLSQLKPEDKIEMYTFGSIYIPDYEIAKLTHFLYDIDVAHKINNVKLTNEPRRDDIIWLKNTSVNKDNDKNYLVGKFFGTSLEWINHNSYNFLPFIIVNCEIGLGERNIGYVFNNLTLEHMYERLGLKCYKNNITSPSETHS